MILTPISATLITLIGEILVTRYFWVSPKNPPKHLPVRNFLRISLMSVLVNIRCHYLDLIIWIKNYNYTSGSPLVWPQPY